MFSLDMKNHLLAYLSVHIRLLMSFSHLANDKDGNTLSFDRTNLLAYLGK